MKKLLGYANEYVRRSDWKDLALLKFCMCAAGVMLGLAVPKRCRKTAAFGAMAVFIASYLPLTLKFLRIVGEDPERN